MTRRVIPIAAHQSPDVTAESARDQRKVLIGITLILLHLVSLAVALTLF